MEDDLGGDRCHVEDVVVAAKEQEGEVWGRGGSGRCGFCCVSPCLRAITCGTSPQLTSLPPLRKKIKAVEDTAGWPLALPQRLYEQRRTVHDEHCSAGSHCSRVSTVLVVRYLPSERRQNSSTLASIALPRAQYFRRRRRPLLPRRLSLLAFLD